MQAAPVGTAVWLPGLGDRWPRHSRLCRLSAHAYLSSHLVVVVGGTRAGRRGCLCTHQVQAGSAAPQGAPGPVLGQLPPPNLGILLSLGLF